MTLFFSSTCLRMTLLEESDTIAVIRVLAQPSENGCAVGKYAT